MGRNLSVFFFCEFYEICDVTRVCIAEKRGRKEKEAREKKVEDHTGKLSRGCLQRQKRRKNAIGARFAEDSTL
jgi:hypothetical protein